MQVTKCQFRDREEMREGLLKAGAKIYNEGVSEDGFYVVEHEGNAAPLGAEATQDDNASDSASQ